MTKPGWVYFLEDETRGLVKIGLTRGRLWTRLRAIQGELQRAAALDDGVGPTLILAAAFLVADPRVEEKRLHRLFYKSRIARTEWFRGVREVLAEATRLGGEPECYTFHDRCLTMPGMEMYVENEEPEQCDSELLHMDYIHDRFRHHRYGEPWSIACGCLACERLEEDIPELTDDRADHLRYMMGDPGGK